MLSSGKKGRCSSLFQMSYPELCIFSSHSVQLAVRHLQHNVIKGTGDQGTPADFRRGFSTQDFPLSSDGNFSLLLPSPYLSLNLFEQPCSSHESYTEGFTQAGFIELHYRRLYLRWPRCNQNNLSLLILPVTSLSIWQR